MKPIHIILGLVILLQVGYVEAQELSTLSTGDRVRIKAPSFSWDQVSGNIVTINADTLVLKSKKQTSLLKVPLTYVTGLERANGKKRNTLKGAGIGLLIGAGVGALAGLAAGEDCPPSRSGSTGLYALDLCFSKGSMAAVGSVMAGVTGTVLGAVIGSFGQTDRWEDVPIDRIRLGILPQRQGGLAFSASVTF
jgi:hypothetical protein